MARFIPEEIPKHAQCDFPSLDARFNRVNLSQIAIIPEGAIMTTIKAHFDGKTFVTDQPVSLPLDHPVTLHIDAINSRRDTTTKQERLQRLEVLENMPRESIAPEADFYRDSIYSRNIDVPR